jgi:signal transduction histidine kinase/ABC-type amino acid transport substrate-binding protein/CheY-like chemotaxis protein
MIRLRVAWRLLAFCLIFVLQPGTLPAANTNRNASPPTPPIVMPNLASPPLTSGSNLGHHKGILVVGGDDSFPPYEFLDENGQPTGYNVDLTRAIARHLGLTVDIRLKPWSKIRENLAKNRIDVLQGMFYSPQRDEIFDFSPAHTLVSHAIVVRIDSEMPASMEMLSGKSILVQSGDIMHDLAIQKGLKKQLFPVETTEKALGLLAAGRYDCALVTKIPALYWIKKRGWENLKISKASMVELEYCYAAAGGNEVLLAKLSEALTTIKASGEYQQIASRWLGVYEKPTIGFLGLLKYLFYVLAPVLLLLMGVFFWSRTLQRKVTEQTTELRSEITERKRAEKALRYRIELEELIAAVSARFIGISQDRIDHEINRTLKRVGRFTGIDRSYLFMLSDNGAVINNTHEWCSPGIVPQIENLQRLPASTLPWWMEKLHRNEVIHIPCVDDLPAEADTEKGLLQSQNIRSLLTVPLTLGSTLTGFIGFDAVRIQKSWTKMDITLLRTLADIIAQTLAHRQVEQELQKMQRLESIGTLAGGIAHDFNNILMGLFGNIAIAKETLIKDHPGFKPLEEAGKSMNRAIRLTRQLLTFAKGGEPVKENINLGSLIEDVARFDLTGSNVSVIFKKAQNLWIAEGDKGQLQQVFSNLIINANQSMPDGGHLYITLKNMDIPKDAVPNIKQGEYIKSTVQDEGTGINKKHLDRIFDPYFTTKQTGSGLGLATVYSIIKRHGGGISVDSQLGRGTTFTLYFRASKLSTIPEPARQLQEHRHHKQAASILVMDDEEMVREVTTQMLKKMGFTVETASDGKQAIEMYKQAMDAGNAFEALIMDLTIPGGMGGKEAIKHILKIDPEAIAIVSSGYADDPVMANYTQYGFKGIAAKPYTMDHLQEVVNRVLEN